MHRLLFIGLCVLVAAGATRRSEAQNTGPAELEAELEVLAGEVAKLAADQPTLSSSVADITARIMDLEKRLDVISRGQQAVPNAIESIDGLERDTKALRLDVEALRTRLADVEQPVAYGSGGGGGVGYDDGFRWSSDDGTYSLRLGGYLQWRMGAKFAEDVDGDVERTEAGFDFARTRLFVGGDVSGSEFFFLVDPRIEQALLEFWIKTPTLTLGAAELRAVVGQTRSPFSRFFMTWAPDSLFATRPSAVEDLRYDRSIGFGVDVSLWEGRIWSTLRLANASGPGSPNDNLDVAAMARLEAALLGARPARYSFGDLRHEERPVLVLGVGAIHDLAPLTSSVAGVEVGERDVDADGDIDNIRVLSLSADLLFRWHGFELVGEAIFRQEDWGTIFDHPDNVAVGDLFEFDDTRNYVGLVGQVSYALRRGGWLSRDTVIGARLGHHRQAVLRVDGRSRQSPPRSDRLLEASATVQRYWGHTKRRQLGLQYTYLNHNNKDSAEIANDEEHRAMAEIQFLF